MSLENPVLERMEYPKETLVPMALGTSESCMAGAGKDNKSESFLQTSSHSVSVNTVSDPVL